MSLDVSMLQLWPTGFNECSQQELSIFSGKQSDLQELHLTNASPFMHNFRMASWASSQAAGDKVIFSQSHGTQTP